MIIRKDTGNLTSYNDDIKRIVERITQWDSANIASIPRFIEIVRALVDERKALVPLLTELEVINLMEAGMQ